MRPPFFAFYPADFANDIHVEAMSTTAVGAYILLLCKAWQADPPGSLPNDDQILARFARVDAEVWREIKHGVLAPFRLGSDGRLHSKRLRLEFNEAMKRINAKKEAGKKGAGKRWGGSKNAATGTTDSSAIGSAIAVPLGRHCLPNGIQNQSLPSEDREKEKEKDPPHPPAKPGGGTGTASTLPLAPPGPEPGDDFDPTLADSVEPVEPWAELVREWAAARLPGHDAPGGIQRTERRVGLWQQRLRDPTWRARWREGVRRAGQSAACRGEDSTFMARGLWLDSFLREPDMLVRILEGQFDDRNPGPGGSPAKTKKDLAVEAAIREDAARRAAAKRKAG